MAPHPADDRDAPERVRRHAIVTDAVSYYLEKARQCRRLVRAINELALAVAKHDEWLQQTNILLVPYHMIGAASIEAGVLGGYARHIRHLHPDASVPGFYMSDRLFRDARQLRSNMGDEKTFFLDVDEQYG